MSHNEIDCRWQPRSSAPFRIAEGDVARINSHEFIVVMEYGDQNRRNSWMRKQAIHKYDSRNDEWMEFADFPAPYDQYGDPEYPKIEIIPETRKLYLCSDSYAMRVLDMDTKEWSVVTPDRMQIMYGLNPLVNADGILHCIGGPDEADHHTWNEEEKEWQCIHDFGATMGVVRDPNDDLVQDDVYDFSMIFVEAKQLILLIGVQDRGSRQRADSLGSIWSFSTKNISENTWQRMEGVTLNCNRVSTVLTADQQFVIISGGQSMSKEFGPQNLSDCIHVLDIRDDHHFILKQCSIRCPTFGQCITLRTGNGWNVENQLFVVGWIRKVFQSEDMKHMQMPPDGVIRLIVQWYDQEMLHWIFCSDIEWFHRSEESMAELPERLQCSDHYVIPVHDILSCLSP